MTQGYAPREEALGICAKSGKQMRLGDMVEDGYYKGLLVAPEWYDAEHPQEKLMPLFDAEAIERPAPDLDATQSEAISIYVPEFNLTTATQMPRLVIYVELNNPTVTVV